MQEKKTDKELEVVKKKYAGATWTAKDARQLAELRKKTYGGFRVPQNPTLCELAVVNGQILEGAVDQFWFTGTKGQQIVIVASARQLIPYIPDAVPGWFQATLAPFDAQGNELAYCDDYRFNPDPVIQCQIPADGEYAVEIKDALYRGRESFVYRITIGELPFVTDIFPLGGQRVRRRPFR